MRTRTITGCALGGLTLLVAVTGNALHGTDRSRELYLHERTADAERVVYKVHRWFVSPQYDITEVIPVRLPASRTIPKELNEKEPDLQELVSGITFVIPLIMEERRFSPDYLNPDFFDRTDPTYEIIYRAE